MPESKAQSTLHTITEDDKDAELWMREQFERVMWRAEEQARRWQARANAARRYQDRLNW